MVSGRKRVWFTVDCALPSEVARTAFNDRLSSVRNLLSPGRPKLDNLGLMMALLDLNVMDALNRSACAHSSQCSTEWKLFTLLRYIDIATAYNRNYKHRLAN